MTEEKKNVPDLFASMVFNDAVMRSMLPREVYKELLKTINDGKRLDEKIADVVASAMKEWALKKGATHFTHWFQPMTGITAEKHDSFITAQRDGSIIMDFSGKELVKGEPDASSFPSGGLRATFEARGYTAWDPTSFAFIKDNTLCIPTAFCSYTGQILDKKTPLLRSMDAINTQAKRILALFEKYPRRVNVTVGAEQEYFLIDKEDYKKRPDLILTGRTLIGAAAPKGQEKEDHYFGSIRPRVKAFMEDFDRELWKLGIKAKTEHNEVAPCQHEMAPIFDKVNIATDSNQLTMEIIKKVADRHDFACLLHEKPFSGVNGSGKHNNWSLETSDGENLLDPGITPQENALFLLVLTAVIKAVDDYQDLLRLSVASLGNDFRLGGNEAPPAIVSVFVGSELEEVINAIIEERRAEIKNGVKLDIGAASLPQLPRDNSDRNRTSPFAFTGNKFEFRMLGSSFNIGCTNTIINTAVADTFSVFASELENAGDFKQALHTLIKRELKKHKRIIFNGNGYSREWEEEAEKRGLTNYRTTPEALVHYHDEKNVELFKRQKVYTREEIISREEILLDEYRKQVHIEASMLLEMLTKQIIPSSVRYSDDIAKGLINKKALSIKASGEEKICRDVTELVNRLSLDCEALKNAALAMPDDARSAAFYAKDIILPLMQKCRDSSDELEMIVGKDYWPIPTYTDILFYV